MIMFLRTILNAIYVDIANHSDLYQNLFVITIYQHCQHLRLIPLNLRTLIERSIGNVTFDQMKCEQILEMVEDQSCVH